VAYNGSFSMVVSADQAISRTLFSSPHARGDVELLLGFAARLGLVTQYYLESSGDVFAVPHTAEHREHLAAYAALTGRQQIIGSDYKDAFSQSPAAKVLLMTHDADVLIAAAVTEFPSGKFNIIRGSPEPFFVEFLPANISKGSGLINMCMAVGIALEEVVAFGDGNKTTTSSTTASTISISTNLSLNTLCEGFLITFLISASAIVLILCYYCVM
jgi:hydroxymethylpyrimidine pyrophosphatase-like HAD family hydrolase